jgi:hypothetical protein
MRGKAVVGGSINAAIPGAGDYYVRVTGRTPSSLLHAVMVLQNFPEVSHASWWELTPTDETARRHPMGRVQPSEPDGDLRTRSSSVMT